MNPQMEREYRDLLTSLGRKIPGQKIDLFHFTAGSAASMNEDGPTMMIRLYRSGEYSLSHAGLRQLRDDLCQNQLNGFIPEVDTFMARWGDSLSDRPPPAAEPPRRSEPIDPNLRLVANIHTLLESAQELLSELASRLNPRE